MDVSGTQHNTASARRKGRVHAANNIQTFDTGSTKHTTLTMPLSSCCIEVSGAMHVPPPDDAMLKLRIVHERRPIASAANTKRSHRSHMGGCQ